MRILVNDVAASTNGALSILKDFYKYILDNDYENQWIFLLNDNYIEETENIKVIVRKDLKKSWIKRLFFDIFFGARYVKKLNVDAIFSLQNTCILNSNLPKATYIHQSIPFQDEKNFSFFKKNEFKLAVYQYLIGTIIKKSIKKSDLVIVQTKWMKNKVKKYSRNNAKIINSLPIEKYESKNNYKLEENLFFYPASGEVYKNHKCILNACKLLNDRGIRNFKVFFTLSNRDKGEIVENIYNLGTLTKENVYEMYEKTVLIFPSYIETVGLPLLEAKNIGTVILSSNCEFAKEVLGNYSECEFFNPFDCNDLANYMEKIILRKKPIVTITQNEKIYNNGWKEIYNEIIKIKRR